MPNTAATLLLGRSLGARPTPLDGNETYLALQTGAVDGQENAFMPAYNAKFQEVCETICRTDHLCAGNTVALHAGTWNKMTPEQQELFAGLMAEAAALQVNRLVVEEKRIAEELESKGMLMQHPDRNVFRKHVQEFYMNDPISDSWDMILYERIKAMGNAGAK
jgi:TRAP-type C4-dicarboxylate transport system, periplasmic component